MKEESNVRRHVLNAFKDGELERDNNNVHFLHFNGVKKPVPFLRTEVTIETRHLDDIAVTQLRSVISKMHFASFNIWLFGGVMFQVTKEEWNVLRSQIVTANPAEYQSVEEWRLQIVTSNFAKMGLRRPPYAFTRNGIGGNALSAKVT